MREPVANCECASFNAQQDAVAAENERLLQPLAHTPPMGLLPAFHEPMLTPFGPGGVVLIKFRSFIGHHFST
jgi:hypothetical protein